MNNWKKVSEMKPVVANASEIFENLIAKFKASDTDKKIQKQTNQILGKLQRIFHSENLEQFKNLNGGKNQRDYLEEFTKFLQENRNGLPR